MSYTFSRRSFLKYSALAAVAVAGAGLLSGCEMPDPNNPTAKALNATLQIGTTTAQLQNVEVENGTGVFTIRIANDSDAPQRIGEECFSVKVRDTDGNVTFSSGSSLTVTSEDLNNIPDLAAGKDAIYKVIVPGYTNPEADGTLEFKYIPLRNQSEYSLNWNIPAANLNPDAE